MKILVLGATGLLGNAVYRSLSKLPFAQTIGTVRKSKALSIAVNPSHQVLVEDIEDPKEQIALFDAIQPNVVINCVAVGRPAPPDPMRMISVYALLPQRLSHLCKWSHARFIQISSDGVFSGRKGEYKEDDLPDADDIYGTSKLLGEIDAPHAITLRTSIVGHEIQPGQGLLDWFLSQQSECRCYTHAIFSGFPTIVLADLIRDVVIPRSDLWGIYHVAARPISKFELLRLVAERYGKDIRMIADDRPAPNRSLSAERFARATGYRAPDWPTLIDAMYRDWFDSVGHDVQG